MNIKHLPAALLLIIILSTVISLLSLAFPSNAEDIATCDTIVLSSPRGNGVSYEGTLKNSDYRFSAIIPSGVTGWGAGSSAPFHGFMIYFDNEDKPQSCIDFSIGYIVDLDDGHNKKHLEHREKKVKIGNRSGFESFKRGFKNGISIDDITVFTQLDHQFKDFNGNVMHSSVGVGVRLITPTKSRNITEPIFRRFVSDLKFDDPVDK